MSVVRIQGGVVIIVQAGGGWFYVKIWEKGLVQYLFIWDFDFKKIDLEGLPNIFKFHQFRIEEEQVVERGF